MRAMFDKSKEKSGREGFFGRLKKRLSGGKGLNLSLNLIGRKLDAELAEELETQLLLADVGIEASERIIDGLRRRLGSGSIDNETVVRDALRESVAEALKAHARPLVITDSVRPFMILMVGVNGSGKTTTIGKLARMLKDQGHSIMLAAAVSMTLSRPKPTSATLCA